MPVKIRQKLPENCIQCGKAEAGDCPYHVGEERDPHLSRKLIRGSRKLLHLDGLLPDGRSLAPNVVVLMPTMGCNLSCIYCFQRGPGDAKAPLRSEKRLSAAEWLSVIAEIKPLHLPVIVMGGELFLYPEILTLLRAIKDADLSLTVITNGFELSKFARELVEMGLDNLIVSLDGPEDVHNQVRNHPKSYQRATEGIRQVLVARGVCAGPFVQVSCTISAFTQSHLRSFVERLGTLGVDRIVFNSLIYATAEQVAAQAEILKTDFATDYTGAGLENDAFAGIDPAIIQLELSAIRAGPWADKVFVAPPGVEHNLEAYYAPPTLPFQKQFCTAIYRELWLLPDGNMAACVHLPELTMGNVCQEGLMAVWNGPRYRLLRQRLASGLLPACIRCEKLTYEHP
jgi:MoaA/NifB/PqqE/SkfB family radical SAM enzyme